MPDKSDYWCLLVLVVQNNNFVSDELFPQSILLTNGEEGKHIWKKEYIGKGFRCR